MQNASLNTGALEANNIRAQRREGEDTEPSICSSTKSFYCRGSHARGYGAEQSHLAAKTQAQGTSQRPEAHAGTLMKTILHFTVLFVCIWCVCVCGWVCPPRYMCIRVCILVTSGGVTLGIYTNMFCDEVSHQN